MLKDKGILKALWAGMYLMCTIMGFAPVANKATQILLIILAALFFVPPFADIWFSWKRKDYQELRLVRNLCIISLSTTTVLLIANVLSALSRSMILGDILYYLLVLCSCPMICGQFWAYSLMLWAILLWCCIAALQKKKHK